MMKIVRIKTKTLIIILTVLVILIIISVLVVRDFRDPDVEKVGIEVDAPHYGPLSFAVFGDPRIGHDSNTSDFFYPQKLSSVIDEVNKTEIQFVIVTGDMYWDNADDEEDAIETSKEFAAMMTELEAEWYPVMGNHEAEGLGWAVTRDIIFEDLSTYYSFDFGDCHFIILDAYVPGHKGSLSEAQMSWLEYDIRTTPKPHIFVFLHPPLFPTGSHYGDSLDNDVRDKLFDIFTEYQVDIVFCGHEHYYSSFEYQGLMQVTTGGAGAQPLHDYKDYSELLDEFGYNAEDITRYEAVKTFHYVIIDVKGIEIDVDVYDLDGLLIDTFSVTSERAFKTTVE